MKVKSESEVAQSCLTPRDPVDCSLPGPSIHGIFQARVLEWGAISSNSLEISLGEKQTSNVFSLSWDKFRILTYIICTIQPSLLLPFLGSQIPRLPFF